MLDLKQTQGNGLYFTVSSSEVNRWVTVNLNA